MALDIFPTRTGSNEVYEVLALSIAQNLTLREFTWMQGVVPYTASYDFYEQLKLNSSTSTSRKTIFDIETAGSVVPYNDYYSALSANSKTPLPYKTIYSGEFSYGCSEIAVNIEEVQRYSGDQSRLQHIIYQKMKAKMMSFYTNFQDYIERVIKNSNQFYPSLKAVDGNGIEFYHPIPVGLNNGNTALSLTQGFEKAFGTGFETFNQYTGKVVDFIGYETSGARPLHIMSNALKRTLYAQSAKLPNPHLVSYTNAVSEFVWKDELNGSTVACGNRPVMRHVCGTAIPKYNIGTELLEGGATNFVINAITFRKEENLGNLLAGTITVGATGGNGLTLKTGDVFYIKGTELMKNTFGLQTEDTPMAIVVAPKATYDPLKDLNTYTDQVITGAGGTFTFEFVGNFRPDLADNSPHKAQYNPNFKITGANIRLKDNAGAFVLDTDTATALAGKTLIPLVGDREAVVVYYPKKIFFSPREVILSTDLFSTQLQTTMKSQVPDFGRYLENSCMPVTATFNKMGNIAQTKGLDMVFQLWAESGCVMDDYQINSAIIPVVNYSSSRQFL